MTRKFVPLLDLIPLAPGTRRAVDETRADWRHEHAAANGTVARSVVTIRGLVAVLSVLARAGAAEVRTPGAWAMTGAVLRLATAASSLLALDMESARPPLSRVAVFLVPQGLSLFIPVACAVVAASGIGRSARYLGATALILAAALLVNGWVTPTSNQLFRQVEFERFQRVSGSAIAQPLMRGYPEMPAWILVDASRRGDYLAARQLNLMTALTGLVPLCVGIGIASGRLWRRQWVGRVAACVGAVLIFPLGALGGRVLSYGLIRLGADWFAAPAGPYGIIAAAVMELVGLLTVLALRPSPHWAGPAAVNR